MADTPNSPKPPKIVNSTLIQAYSYDEHDYTLSVTFKNGTTIEYLNVMPPVVSKVFDTPGSIGSKFHKNIGSAGYKFERAEP